MTDRNYRIGCVHSSVGCLRCFRRSPSEISRKWREAGLRAKQRVILPNLTVRHGWALQWVGKNGPQHLVGGPFYQKWLDGTAYMVVTFETRQQARDFRKKHFGYISERPDLRGHPHYWRMPKIVKVTTTVEVYA